MNEDRRNRRGVVGVSIAVRLAQRGASVTLVDQAWPGSGTSSTSYAWINSHNKQPDSYYALNLAGMRAHQRCALREPDGFAQGDTSRSP